MRTLLISLLIILLASVAVGLAQNNPPATGTVPQQDTLSANNRMIYGHVKMILLTSAEKMPEESYAFKPADTVRAYGQLIGHVADSQYSFCSTVLGEKSPAPGIEKNKTSKADLVAALKEACAYCDKAYDTMTAESATQTVKLMGRDMPKLGVLTVNILHSMEHYGNLVTYMRMKGIVPPTSEPGFGQPPKK